MVGESQRPACCISTTLVRSIYAQPDRDTTYAQYRQVVDHLQGRFPEAAELPAEA